MTSSRRIGTEGSATRLALLEAASNLILEEGYSSVTSRKVAAKAGLKPQLVHYYFRTMDDLFVALVRRGAEQNLERQAAVFDSPSPLRAFWEFSNDPSSATMNIEFAALANHRKAIRAEMATYAEQFRRLQTEALARIVGDLEVGGEALPPEVIALLVTAVSQVLGMEAALGVSSGHDAVRGLIESWIDRVEVRQSKER